MTTKDEALLALLHAIDIRCGSLPLAIEEAYTAYKKTPKQAQEPVKFLAKDEALQGLSAYLRCEAGGVHQGHPSHQTLMQWAREVDAIIKQAQQAQEPVLYQRRMKPDFGTNWTHWDDCSEATFKECLKVPKLHDWTHEARALYTHPAPQQAQEQVQPYTYASTQATKCASCGVHKHTPLRVDFMGGYVCLTCIDVRLEELHDAATLHSKQISNWHEKHDALLEQQLAAPSKEWNDENVIAWCVERGIQAAHPAPQRPPLTAQEVDAILSQHDYDLHGDCIKYIVRMTERAHHIGEAA